MKDLIIIISLFIFGVLSVYTFFLVVNEAINQPYVYKSWSRQECVFIEYADGTTSDCSKLKELGSYELKWVE